MKLQGKIVLIKPDEYPKRTKGGVLLSPTAMDKYMKGKPMGGTIIDTGPVCKWVNKGMKVLFPARSASVIVLDNQDYYMISENRITYMPEQ